jgi:hypothetical protein
MIEGKPTMKPILTPCPAAAVILAYLMVGMASLACMTSTMPATPTQTAIPAATTADLQNCVRDSSHAQFCRDEPASGLPTEPQAGTVFWIPTPGPLCATVTAIQSLHLRAQPNERAQVLGYLHNGEQVRVIAFGLWWKLSTREETGYANSKYLSLTESEE